MTRERSRRESVRPRHGDKKFSAIERSIDKARSPACPCVGKLVAIARDNRVGAFGETANGFSLLGID